MGNRAKITQIHLRINADVQRSIMEDIKYYLPNYTELEYWQKFNARGESIDRNGQCFGTTCDQVRIFVKSVQRASQWEKQFP